MTLPTGWALHPQNPQFMYEVANPANVLAIPAAHVAPAPQPAQPAEYSYGALDVDIAAQQYDALGKFGDRGEELWLDFDKVSRVGEESILLVRLLPPWAKGEREANVLQVRHRVFAEYWPGDTGKRQIMWPVCLNQTHGPGDCPIDALIEEASTSNIPGFAEHVENFKPQKRMVWQGIDMTDPRKHWVQAKDPNTKMPIIGADGQPVWILQPGFVGMKQTLHRSVLEFVRDKGDPTNPETGYVMKLKKRKEGTQDRDVKYSSMDADHIPLDEQLRPALGNLVNLRERFVTNAMPKHETLVQFCDAVRAKWGVMGRSVAQVPGGIREAPLAPQSEGWVAHPQNPAYEYLPGTAQVRPRAATPPQAAPAVPAVPPLPAVPPVPVAGPPVPAYPPGPPAHPHMPSMAQLGAPPQLAAPAASAAPVPAQGPPTGAYPPPAAPGLSAPGGLPQGGDFPPPPPPGPGMPPGPPQAAAPPPPPPGPPPGPGPLPDGHGATQGMTPEQLEAALASKSPSAPF